MKVNVTDLEPNPFRNIDQYPIIRERVEKLKGSISNTDFWGGLVCRKHGDKYQLAFGHHRLKALEELGYKEIDVKVLPYDETQMLRSMAEENRDIGQHDPKIMINTVEQIKHYLDGELAKYDDIKKLPKLLINLLAEKNQAGLGAARKGVGQNTVLKFLNGDGKQTWNQSEIQFALSSVEDIKNKVLDRKAVETFPNRYQAEQFKMAVKAYDIPVNEQQDLAKRITKQVKGGREVIQQVQREADKKSLKKEDPIAKKIERLMIDVSSQAKALHNKLMILRSELEKLDVQQLKGAKAWLAKNALTQLFKEIKRSLGKE